jgi:hypothetical protein
MKAINFGHLSQIWNKKPETLESKGGVYLPVGRKLPAGWDVVFHTERLNCKKNFYKYFPYKEITYILGERQFSTPYNTMIHHYLREYNTQYPNDYWVVPFGSSNNQDTKSDLGYIVQRIKAKKHADNVDQGGVIYLVDDTLPLQLLYHSNLEEKLYFSGLIDISDPNSFRSKGLDSSFDPILVGIVSAHQRIHHRLSMPRAEADRDAANIIMRYRSQHNSELTTEGRCCLMYYCLIHSIDVAKKTKNDRSFAHSALADRLILCGGGVSELYEASCFLMQSKAPNVEIKILSRLRGKNDFTADRIDSAELLTYMSTLKRMDVPSLVAAWNGYFGNVNFRSRLESEWLRTSYNFADSMAEPLAESSIWSDPSFYQLVQSGFFLCCLGVAKKLKENDITFLIADESGRNFHDKSEAIKRKIIPTAESPNQGLFFPVKKLNQQQDTPSLMLDYLV